MPLDVDLEPRFWEEKGGRWAYFRKHRLFRITAPWLEVYVGKIGSVEVDFIAIGKKARNIIK